MGAGRAEQLTFIFQMCFFSAVFNAQENYVYAEVDTSTELLVFRDKRLENLNNKQLP